MFNCFCSAGDNTIAELPRVVRPAKASRIKRQGSDTSRISCTSSKSNESISKLPPCKRVSDPQIEAMMMPVPGDARPSKCLRLSYPRIYTDIVSDMKACKGCRDWRSFPVFYAEDVDMSISADEAARKRALDYQRKLQQFGSFDSDNVTNRSASVDMIG